MDNSHIQILNDESKSEVAIVTDAGSKGGPPPTPPRNPRTLIPVQQSSIARMKETADFANTAMMHKSTGLPISVEELRELRGDKEGAIRKSYATAVSFLGTPNTGGGISMRGASQERSVTMIHSGGVNLGGRYDKRRNSRTNRGPLSYRTLTTDARP